MLLVTCNNCGAMGFTVSGADFAADAAVRCVTPADDPPGSPEGSCCREHSSHEDHADYVRQTGESGCRPVTITVLPGTVSVQHSQGQLLSDGPAALS
jgi:hypothetical protein